MDKQRRLNKTVAELLDDLGERVALTHSFWPQCYGQMTFGIDNDEGEDMEVYLPEESNPGTGSGKIMGAVG